eukprot:COSAG02_NODE_5110_length_4620_cov_1.897810_3_plen_61_part_00
MVTRHGYLKQRRCERHRAHVGQPRCAGLVLQVLKELVALAKQLCTHANCVSERVAGLGDR